MTIPYRVHDSDININIDRGRGWNFNWITHILAKSIKWFVYSFKWYLGILKVSTTHLCVTCGNIHTIQYQTYCLTDRKEISTALMLCGKNLTPWPWKSIGFQTLLRTMYVLSLVKIHWRMLGLFTASSDTLEYSKLVQHICVWHVEIYIQYNRLVYEINKDTKFA
jgi:hypothetical protein